MVVSLKLPAFVHFFSSLLASSSAAPKRVKMIPACELIPTAVTRTLPDPSMTWVPESSIGSTSAPFLTWSDSPVREDSSILRSLLCKIIPSAGRRSPYLTYEDEKEQRLSFIKFNNVLFCVAGCKKWQLSNAFFLVVSFSFFLMGIKSYYAEDRDDCWRRRRKVEGKKKAENILLAKSIQRAFTTFRT